MSYKLRKIVKTGMWDHVTIIKSFPTKQERDHFMNSQYDNAWGETQLNLSPGTYKETQPGAYYKVANLAEGLIPHL